VLDNGYLRFGQGNAASIGTHGTLSGILYGAGAERTALRPLSRSYGLLIHIGVGSDNGNHWAGVYTTNINSLTARDPIVDTSGFVQTSTGGRGHGTINVRRTFSYRGADFLMTHTYTLGADDRFLRVDTSVTNVGSTTIENVRLWVGEGDDYLFDDGPRKTRSNLVDGAFQPLAEPADASSALRLEDRAGYAVLLYSAASGTGTVWGSCCSLPSDVNPATNAAQSSFSDGSYALTLALGRAGANVVINYVAKPEQADAVAAEAD
jgi:hypothetical protein